MSSSHENYGIVVDSGSSGSRIQIYKWKDPAHFQKNSDDSAVLHSVPQIVQEEKWGRKIAPGLSDFADIPNAVWDEHFKGLIEHAENIVPESQHSSTPIFVQATAGMRMVPEKQRLKLLKTVCQSIQKNSNFYIPNCEEHVQVIDGELEGLYGWIGLNYLKGKLNNYDVDLPVVERDSYGFMDMGGASMQISFVPSDEKELENHQDELYKVNLRSLNGESQQWPVFVSTWLKFGANEARKRHLSSLISNLPKDISYDMDGDSKYDLLDPCSPKGMDIEHEFEGVVYDIKGSGDYKMCLKQIYPLLLKNLPCKQEPCLFNGVHAPAIDFRKDKFVGVSEYWYTANDVFHMGGNYNFLKFEERLKEFCELEWSEIKSNFENGQYGSNIKQKILEDSCFKASWVVNVLHDGFQLPRIGIEAEDLSDDEIQKLNKEDTEHIPFQSANLIDGAELSWTLGKILLYASSQVPTQETIDVGVIPSSFKQQVAASSKQNPQNSSSIGSIDTETMTIPFVLFISTFFLFGYVVFIRKRSTGKSLNALFSGSTYIKLQQVFKRFFADLKGVYYSSLATSEEAGFYDDDQTNLDLEEGRAIPKPSTKTFLNSNTLRTRSTVNLQDTSNRNDIPHISRSFSANSLPSRSSSTGQITFDGRSNSTASFDFMGKKYNKYPNRSTSPNRHKLPQTLNLVGGSQVELKTLLKGKNNE